MCWKMSVVLMSQPALLMMIRIGQKRRRKSINQENKDDNSGCLWRGEMHSGKVLILLVKMLSALVQARRIFK